jgi:hypothetical protein
MSQTTWKAQRYLLSGVNGERTARRKGFTLRVRWWRSGTIVGSVEQLMPSDGRRETRAERRIELPKGANTNRADAEPVMIDVQSWAEREADALKR